MPGIPIQPVVRPEDINIFSRSFKELIASLVESVAEFERMRNDISVRLALPVRDLGGGGTAAFNDVIAGVIIDHIEPASGSCYSYNARSCKRKANPDFDPDLPPGPGNEETLPLVEIEAQQPINRVVDCEAIDLLPAGGPCILVKDCELADVWHLVCWETIETTDCPEPEP